MVCANPFSPRYPPCLAAVQGISSIVWRLTTVRRHQVHRTLSRLQFEQAFLFTFSHRSLYQPLLTSFYKVPPGSFATAETLWFGVDWTARYALFVPILALVIFSSAYARLGQFINEFCFALNPGNIPRLRYVAGCIGVLLAGEVVLLRFPVHLLQTAVSLFVFARSIGRLCIARSGSLYRQSRMLKG